MQMWGPRHATLAHIQSGCQYHWQQGTGASGSVTSHQYHTDLTWVRMIAICYKYGIYAMIRFLLASDATLWPTFLISAFQWLPVS